MGYHRAFLFKGFLSWIFLNFEFLLLNIEI